MSKATRDALQRRPVIVTLRGDVEIECQCPDPETLITQDVFPLTVYAHVLEVLAAWSAAGSGPSIGDEMQKDPLPWLSFMDRWACAAGLAPRIVRPGEQADGVTTLSVDDLDMDDKVAIFGKTNKHFKHATRLGDAIKEFRDRQPDGVGAGPDGAPVRDAAVDAPAGA